MSADEGASWAAADASDAAEVVRLQEAFNPGKLATHELALHGWILLFGDSLVAMRSMSAALGTLAVLLVFLVTREMFRPGREPGEAAEIAAASALLFAVNLITIKYSREARMYPVLLAGTLFQMWFFIRAERGGGWLNYLAVVCSTALVIATHFTAVFVIGAEGLWLIYRAATTRALQHPDEALPARRNLLLMFTALIAAVAILTPFAPAAIRSSAGAVAAGAIDWIERPALWEPLAMFNKATGSIAFPVLAALVIWGVIRGWRSHPSAVRLALVWMWAPVVMLTIVSYLLRPLLLERYALTCFVPFFVLAAVGAWKLGPRPWRYAALGLAVVLSLGHIAAYYRKPHDAQWREAVVLASGAVSAGAPIVVAPAFAVNVVRYYLPPERRIDAQAVGEGKLPGAQIVVLGDQGVPDAVRHEILTDYPRVLSTFRGIAVRGK